jgi:hypothetical protein
MIHTELRGLKQSLADLSPRFGTSLQLGQPLPTNLFALSARIVSLPASQNIHIHIFFQNHEVIVQTSQQSSDWAEVVSFSALLKKADDLAKSGNKKFADLRVQMREPP